MENYWDKQQIMSNRHFCLPISYPDLSLTDKHGYKVDNVYIFDPVDSILYGLND